MTNARAPQSSQTLPYGPKLRTNGHTDQRIGPLGAVLHPARAPWGRFEIIKRAVRGTSPGGNYGALRRVF